MDQRRITTALDKYLVTPIVKAPSPCGSRRRARSPRELRAQHRNQHTLPR
jgi:hypothetical protein